MIPLSEQQDASVQVIREAFAREARNIGRDWHKGVIEDCDKTGRIPEGPGRIAELERAAVAMHKAGKMATTPKSKS